MTGIISELFSDLWIAEGIIVDIVIDSETMNKSAMSNVEPEITTARLKGLKYDPAQPRDESGQWGSGGATGTSGSVAAEQRRPKTKAEIAKTSAVRCDAEIQRYAEDVNEVQIAGQLSGEALKDNEPADVVVEIEGKTHGIELKTVVLGKNDKLTMKKDAQDRKRSWSRKNKATFHTVVLDDRDVFNANGPGKHDLTKRTILYRRGYGSFRLANMHEVKDTAELKELMGMDRRKLPAGAKAEEVMS